MKVAYVQKGEATVAWMGSDPGMVGVARKRPGDRWSPVVGLAVALLKAEFGGPTGQDKDAFMLVPFTDKIEHLELSDTQVLVWADLRHGMRVGLKAIQDRRAREEVLHKSGWRTSTRLPEIPSIPSDGQLCENFALRFVSEVDLQMP